MIIIAVDFDGTLCRDKWPKVGEVDVPMVGACIDARRAGIFVILNTCRQGKDLMQALRAMNAYGLEFDRVNENREKGYRGHPECRKIFADFYYDDKTFNWNREEALEHLTKLIAQERLKVEESNEINSQIMGVINNKKEEP
jgi:hypothetical protein